MGCRIPFLFLKSCDFIGLLVSDTGTVGFVGEWWQSMELKFLRLALSEKCQDIISTEALLGRVNMTMETQR